MPSTPQSSAVLFFQWPTTVGWVGRPHTPEAQTLVVTKDDNILLCQNPRKPAPRATSEPKGWEISKSVYNVEVVNRRMTECAEEIGRASKVRRASKVKKVHFRFVLSVLQRLRTQQ